MDSELLEKQTEHKTENLHTGIPNINSAKKDVGTKPKKVQLRINCIHLGHLKRSTTRTIPKNHHTIPLPYNIHRTSRQLPKKAPKHQEPRRIAAFTAALISGHAEVAKERKSGTRSCSTQT